MSDGPPENPAETSDYQLPEISPELRAVFGKIDALLVGLNQAEALDAAARFYMDEHGEPRIRHELHLVPNDPDTDAIASIITNGAQDENLAAADLRDDESVYIRDTDLLTSEDRERGEQIMQSVLTAAERRRADRADGVIKLSRERLIRLQRLKGLPAPD